MAHVSRLWRCLGPSPCHKGFLTWRRSRLWESFCARVCLQGFSLVLSEPIVDYSTDNGSSSSFQLPKLVSSS
eukprot:6976115-Alexandrium_andersonii.AAC.1